MGGRIVGLVCCFLCAFPLFVMSHYGKDSRDPMSFWARDASLKKKVKDVKGYNYKISQLYKKCSMTFILIGILCLINIIVGVVCICFVSTFGIYIVWRSYKKILLEYS